MNSIKEKFTRIFRKNCVDVNEPVDNNVSDNDKFKFCESSIPSEEVQVENAGNKDVKPAKNYNDVHYMTEEEWERRQRSKLCRMQLITLLLFPILPNVVVKPLALAMGI